MPTDLFDLATKITADTAAHDRALTESQKKVLALAKEHQALDSKGSTAFKNVGHAAAGATSPVSGLHDVLKNLSSTTVAMQGPLGGIAGRLGGLQSLLGQVSEGATEAGISFGSMAGPIGIAVAGMVATAATAGFLTKQFYDLVAATADFQGKMLDLSQQTGVSIETLSALEIVAKTTGGSIEAIAASLDIFQRKLEEAQDPESKVAGLLKEIGVETNSTEEAFRQSLAALARMPEGYKQTATALELYGRGGKALLAILKETDGDLDGTMAKFRQMGILISTEDAKAADEFNDQMAMMGFQVRAVGAEVVRNAIPAFKDMAIAVEKDHDAVQFLASILADLTVLITGPLTGALSTLQFGIDSISQAWLGAQRAALMYLGVSADIAMASQPGASLPATGGMGGVSMIAGLSGGMSGIGKKRGGGGAKAIDEFAQALAKQKSEINEAILGHDKYAKEIDRVVDALAKKKKALTDGQMAQLLSNAETLRGIEAEKDYREFMQKLSEQLFDATHVTDEWDKMLREVDKQLVKNHKSLSDFVGAEQMDLITKLRLIDALKKEAQAMQELNITRLRYAEVTKNTRPRFVDIPESGDPRNDTRARIATDEEEFSRAVFQGQFDKMRQLAESLTSIINDSIHEGFRDGMKAGLAEFALGILQMSESKVLMKLTDSITDALMKGFSNTGGGSTGGGGFLGFLKGILPFIGSALGGVGSKSGGGWGEFGAKLGKPLASGLDYVPYDNFPALLHKGERVMTAAENKGGGLPMVVNFYVQHPSQLGSRETQRQVANKMRGLQLQNALQG
jgi:hypothetical protein